jgi:hypothetical protein
MFVNWHSRRASLTAAHIECWRSTCTCIPVPELKERESVKRVEYCPWFRDIITASGEDFWTMRHGFVYPVTSTAKTGAFVQRLTRMRSRITVTRSEGWCVVSPYSWWHYQVGTYCQVILYPFIGHLNEDEFGHGYCREIGATALTGRVPMMLLRDVLGRE